MSKHEVLRPFRIGDTEFKEGDIFDTEVVMPDARPRRLRMMQEAGKVSVEEIDADAEE